MLYETYGLYVFFAMKIDFILFYIIQDMEDI